MMSRYVHCPPWPATTFRPPLCPARTRLTGAVPAGFSPRRILGLSAFYHDAAAALVIDGVPVAAAQEERFSRRKHDARFPREAIRYCLAEAGLDIGQIDLVVHYEEPFARVDRMLEARAARGPVDNDGDWMGQARRHLIMQSSVRAALRYHGPIGFVPHHVSHAACGFYTSPFEEAACLVVDGVGEWATTTLARASKDGIDLLEEIDYPHSLGLFYSTMTGFLGFSPLSDEYKVMALASYGHPGRQGVVRELVRALPDGSFALDLATVPVGPAASVEPLEAALGLRQRSAPPAAPACAYADLAASTQAVLEASLCRLAARLRERTGAANLVLAGGVALNGSANQAVLRECGYENLHVPPAAGDAGGALGAALFAARELAGRGARPEWHDPFLGPSFGHDEVRASVRDAGLRHDLLTPASVVERSADLLARGATIGWLHGRMEFGPRALGGRSILASPLLAATRDRVNAQIKFREAFRPLAPSLPEEDAHRYFAFEGPTPRPAYYMLLVAPVREGRRAEIPAVVHVDGTARPQLVSRRRQPRFHDLLRAFERRTGVPVLLNTSFNLAGEPIVCTPADAVRTFRYSALDVLVLEDVMVYRD